METLSDLLKQLDDTKQTEIAVKKSIVQHFQSKEYTKADTLKKVNQALEAWDKAPATIGCVKHHWK
ncbi:hypothetical protein [Priestia megaterium]|uniref:hypothetical protein n=1 Tax=Priestia megaterium TaxID=1404 RepID=UPI002795E507|nr:hypothetical protein [Priestia megaterium]